MPGIYDITDKTYIRPADRIDELVGSEEQAFGKYVGHFSGVVWDVPHNLKSTNLLIGLWKDDPTNPTSYWNIQQIDYDNLRVNWTVPVDGKVILYSVRPFVGVAMVYTQSTASKKWTITHNFGTMDIMYTCWTGSNIITPISAQTIDNNTVELSFAFPVTGTCVMVIADPEVNPSIHVDWNNIYNLPSGFPPSPHTHTTDEITGEGIDISTFSGHTIEDFVLNDIIGTKIAPLQPVAGSSPVKYEVPMAYIPSPIVYQFGDSEGIVGVTRVIANSTGDHPLFVTKNPHTQTATLDIRPIVRKVKISGNCVINPGIPDNTAEADTAFSVRLDIGAGLSGTISDKNTVKLALSAGAGATFTKTVLASGEEWDILSPVFAVQGGYTLGLFETAIPPSPVLSTQTNHISLTPPPSSISQIFEITGDNLLELTGRVTQDAVDFSDDHFVFEDTVMEDENQIPIPAPENVDAIYWDTSDNTYIMRSPAMDRNSWVYNKFSPVSKTFFMFGIVTNPATYPHTAISGGFVYALHEVAGGGFELLSAVLADIPAWAWQNVATFTANAMPVVSSGGRLRFRVQGDYLYLLNTTLNSFAVYSISGATKVYEKSLTKIAKDFDIWNDGYASFCFDNEDSLWASDRPAQDPSFEVHKSIDKDMGDCTSFALRDDGYGALGVVPPAIIRYSTNTQMNTVTAYKTGETTIWLKSPNHWTVPLSWSQMLSMLWENYSINAYDDVRIGFFPGDSPTLPNTLYRWEASGFVPFNATELPIMGQTLETANGIQLMTGDKLSYAIYIKKAKDKALQQGSITHNFTVAYKNAGLMYPVPIGGPYNNTDHVEVQCASGTIKIINTIGRVLNGLKLVATPAI